MDDLRRWFSQGLAGHLFALESARHSMELGNADAVDSVRRIAQSLFAGAARDGYPELAIGASLLVDAPGPSIPAHLDRFLVTVRAVLGESRTEPLDILIVDHDPVSYRYLEATLAMPNRIFHHVGSAMEAEAWLAERHPALVVLDLELPDRDGRGLLLMIRSRMLLAAVPILVISAKGGTQARTECFALGADEYIGKPFDPTSLATCVATKLQRAAELTRWSRTDAVTGLANRSTIEFAYEQMRSATASMGMPLSVAVIEAQTLASINERCGPAAGNEFLKQTATGLSRTLREGDLVGRWGGPYFVALFPNAHQAGARRALDKALANARAQDYTGADGTRYAPTFFSAMLEVSHGARLNEVLLRAYRLLARSKAAGGDRGPNASPPPAEAKRALVVEDDEVSASVMRGLLQRNGYRVDRVADGDAAVQHAAAQPSQLMVLDVRLPGADGFEVLRRVRQMPSHLSTPVVMVSSVRDSATIARGLNLGADDYIVKPFSPVELIARISRLARPMEAYR